MELEIYELTIKYLITTPIALGFGIAAFLSGHQWIFIVFTYLKSNSRNNTKIDNFYGKLGLGIGWFFLILLPQYFLVFKTLKLEYDLTLQILFSTIVIGISLQTILFIIITSLFPPRG